jgi:hypothetical protein
VAEVVVRVLAAQAREPGVVVRALPAEPVRAPQPEELTRDQALEASARAEDPPTPAGRLTLTLIGPCRESSLRRDRGIRRLLRELTGRLLRAPTHDWSPAIGTALKAGYCWLDVYCGGYRQPDRCDRAQTEQRPAYAREASAVIKPGRNTILESRGCRSQ